METTRIENRIGVSATPERIWELLADFSGWNRWNPYETDVSGALAFGASISLTEAFPDQAERRVQARLGDWQPQAQLAWVEKRGFLFNMIRYYEIEELEATSCIVANGMIFSGLRGELFHDRSRARIRPALAAINEAIKAQVEAS